MKLSFRMATLTVLNLGINAVSTPQANINACIGSHPYFSNSAKWELLGLL